MLLGLDPESIKIDRVQIHSSDNRIGIIMKLLTTLFIFLSLLGAATAADASASIAELFATPENLHLVRAADKVDACILRHIEATPRADGSVDRSTERYEETDFISVASDEISALRALLLSPKSYDWKASSGGRRPQFYVRLRFHQGEEVVSIDFCFMCHVLSITRQGSELGHANFSPNTDLFVQMFMKLFPADEPLKQVAQATGLPR